MTSFLDYIHSQLPEQGLPIEDIRSRFLPLARQTLACHREGKVAPLSHPERLTYSQKEGLTFAPSESLEIRRNERELLLLQSYWQGALEVVAEHEESASGQETRRRDIVDGAAKLERPAYLFGYGSWEQSIGHHDPLCDVFSLGLILATLACGLDLTDRRQLERFIDHRANLFPLAPDLHPVVAQLIFQMTHLDRLKRPQDLETLIQAIENYRDQPVDLAFDLSAHPEFASATPATRNEWILVKLRERLFDLTRRNRLLHFHGRGQAVNLTIGSIPVSLDPREIPEDQVFVWDEKLKNQIADKKSISLNRILNFNEAIYLPGELDRLISESRKDLAEFGFAQLKLVICFLNWADLKESPPEIYRSPLVLVPVRLIKKKGVRDLYQLQVLDSVAEINPVVRHLLKQRYNVELPETIDLADVELEEFQEYLRQQVLASEPGITFEQITRPQIELVHQRARRRVDQYRRRAQQYGRGERDYEGIEYSYDPANYQPLGLRLFRHFIRPTLPAPLEDEKEDHSRTERLSGTGSQPPTAQARVVEEAEDNPYHWSIDQCNLTLVNLRYRKMSLVRDYDALLTEPITHQVFEDTFSDKPSVRDQQDINSPELADRCDLLACDPTQATSIARARAGASYIIQGPPGTGKSQTIANLIADYVDRGKRVLFVCEKRAAIDVVFARLKQRDVAHLACLIHDSQADKREFIQDLKSGFERLTSRTAGKQPSNKALQTLLDELQPLSQFHRFMNSENSHTGVPLRAAISRAMELNRSPDSSPLNAGEREQLPDYSEWLDHRDSLDRIQRWLKLFFDSRPFSQHPFRWLKPSLASHEQPVSEIQSSLEASVSLLQRMSRCLDSAEIDTNTWRTWHHLRELTDWAYQVLPLARAGKLGVILPDSNEAQWLEERRESLDALRRELDEHQQTNRNWRDRFTKEDTKIALDQAKRMESQFVPWISPAWWRLRSAIHKRYDFAAHPVKPSWRHVLEQLLLELEAEEKWESGQQKVVAELQLEGSWEEACELIEALRVHQQQATDPLGEEGRRLLKRANPTACLESLVELSRLQDEFRRVTHSWLDDPRDATLGDLCHDLEELHQQLPTLPQFVDCLEQLEQLPSRIRAVARTWPGDWRELEAEIVTESIRRRLVEEPLQARFNGKQRLDHQTRLAQTYPDWLDANAARISSRVARRLAELIDLAETPKSKTAQEDREWRQRLLTGLKEIKHEFGKSMRYRPIRDLVAGDSGEVIQSLKPIWLMSPLSVSDTLPLDPQHFDVVIFDEASQITLEEAVPSLFRANQAIIVGDEKQMPPTQFFATRSSEDELYTEEGEGEVVGSLGLEETSFLSHCARVLPSTLLGWHYRSRSESLISFSNWSFYGGRLLTAPDETLPLPDLKELVATTAQSGSENIEGTLARAMSFHRLEHGVYESRRNRAEAEYIAQLVRGLLLSKCGLSLGIVAFSEAQQDEIESALERLARSDSEFKTRLDEELEREVDGQYVGLLIKNLENIQGDERDLIILSVCYGPNPEGRMYMNFGPINQTGGEKRLNVAFSRAKHHMVVVSSITGHAITNDYNPGALALKNYLLYTQAMSGGKREEAERILRSTQSESAQPTETDEWAQPLADQITQWLTDQGFIVERQVGQSRLRCDLAVRKPGDTIYRLGILLDGTDYYDQQDLLEREYQLPELLKNFGWQVSVVLGIDWWQRREDIQQELLEKLAQPHPDDRSQVDQPTPSDSH